MFRKIQAAFISLAMLFAVCSQSGQSVTLTWTATGDDGDVGTAHHYVLKGSLNQSALESDFWGCAADLCIEVPGLPAPLPSGTTQSYEVPEGTFPSGSVVYFRIVAVDEAGNQGIPSNTATKTIPDTVAPAQIIDLR